MIRVLQVVGNMNAGGMETLLMNWYRKIDREKVQFDFLVHSKSKGVYEDEIISLGGRVYHLSFRDDVNFLKYLFDLKKFFEQHVHEYSVVHGHQMDLGVFYLRAAKKAGIPNRIMHSHNSSSEKTMKGKLGFFLQRFSRYYATERFACSTIAGRYLYGKKLSFKMINNGIDTEKFSFKKEIRDRMRKEMDLEGKYVCIHVGRFEEQKNHFFLIDIFEKVYKKNKNAVLLLCGTGTYMEAIRRKVKDLKLENNVMFLGIREDICDLLSAADVFVFPSLYEGLPLTLVEAQASGVPIVCSNTITEETNLTDTYYVLSLSDSTECWANKILSVDSANRDTAYRTVNEKGFNSYDVVKDMQKLYLEMSAT